MGTGRHRQRTGGLAWTAVPAGAARTRRICGTAPAASSRAAPPPGKPFRSRRRSGTRSGLRGSRTFGRFAFPAIGNVVSPFDVDAVPGRRQYRLLRIGISDSYGARLLRPDAHLAKPRARSSRFPAWRRLHHRRQAPPEPAALEDRPAGDLPRAVPARRSRRRRAASPRGARWSPGLHRAQDADARLLPRLARRGAGLLRRRPGAEPFRARGVRQPRANCPSLLFSAPRSPPRLAAVLPPMRAQ